MGLARLWAQDRAVLCQRRRRRAHALSFSCPPFLPCPALPRSPPLFCLPLQAIVRPYLDSKYQIRGIVQRPLGTLFGSAGGMSFRKWLFLWLSQLVQHHASGAAAAAAPC